MNGFFNKYLNLKEMLAEKRRYRNQMARIDALPGDYQYAFKKIQNHMWSFAAGDGLDMLEIQYGLIDLFEEGAAEGRGVLEITGGDVASFCDELLRGAETYAGSRRDKLNRDIRKHAGGAKN